LIRTESVNGSHIAVLQEKILKMDQKGRGWPSWSRTWPPSRSRPPDYVCSQKGAKFEWCNL